MTSYRKFLEAEYARRKLGFYERVCNVFSKVELPLPKGFEKNLRECINFCHLRVTPSSVVLTSITLPTIAFIFLSSLFYIFDLMSAAMLLTLLSLVGVIFYYFFSYPRFLTIYFRSKAASEMSLAIVYMAISMKINASLEPAVAFAAFNLPGPLGLDLKKLLWDLETREILSVVSGLDALAEKWKSQSEEFVDALALLKASLDEPPDRMDKNIREAVRLMLEGTKSRMKKYALNMRNPLKVLSAFGILLPLLGLIFFPILVVFIPEIARPELLAFSYTVLLPSTVYLFLRQYFYTKPYSYHQVELKRMKDFRKHKKVALLLSVTFAIIASLFFGYRLVSLKGVFTTQHFLYSFLIVCSLALAVVIYAFGASVASLGKNEEILRIESELPIALFQLSVTSDVGKPIERNLEDLQPRIRTLKINELFGRILSNIKNWGMSLESAIFDKKVGVVNYYPSRVVRSSLKLLVDIAKRGMLFLAIALRAMSEFLKDADEVNKATDEILSETTSDMQLQALIFAPLSAGIVVGLMAIVIYIFSFFGQSLHGLQEFLGKSMSSVSISAFSFLFNIGKQVPFHYFQLIVGIYMIEVVWIISHFLGELNYGEDEVSKLFNLGKTMLLGIVIYSVAACSLYFGIANLLKLSEITSLI